MKLKNLNLYSDNIIIFAFVYQDVFLVKCNGSTFPELKNSDLEVDAITVYSDNDVHIYSSVDEYIFSSVKNYNARFVVEAFDTGLTVLNTKGEEITKDDFFNYLND